MLLSGNSKEELVPNENKFQEVASKYKLTLNESKTVSAEIKPDPERLNPLKKLGVPFLI